MARSPRPEEDPAPPLPAWVPWHRAYLAYSSVSYLHTPYDWRSHAESLIGEFAEDDGGEHPEPFSVGPAGDDRSIDVHAFHLVLTISPEKNHFALAPASFEQNNSEGDKADESGKTEGDEHDLLGPRYDDQNINDIDNPDVQDVLRLQGEPAEFLRKCAAFEGPQHHAFGVDWHRRLVEYFVREQNEALAEAIECGAAHVMARANDIRAPFERIMPDQLHYFTVGQGDDAKPTSSGRPLVQGDERQSVAAGPDGAKLFSIRVAPGTAVVEDGSAMAKCEAWIKDLAQRYPNGRPYTRDQFLIKARELFRDHGPIPRRGFRTMLSKHQPESWKRGGRPKNRE